MRRRAPLLLLVLALAALLLPGTATVRAQATPTAARLSFSLGDWPRAQEGTSRIPEPRAMDAPAPAADRRRNWRR